MFFPKHSYCITVISTALCALFIFSGCNNIEKLDSTWCDRDVVIDGLTGEAEWDSARYIYDKPNFILGLMNDDTHIYLSLATSDEALVKKISGYGFTVWFNDDGNKDATIGFHYPIGKQRRKMNIAQQALNARQNGEETQDDQGAPERSPATGSDGMNNAINPVFNQCAIYISDTRDIYTLTLYQIREYDIEAALTIEDGLLVYELKFPIVCSEETPFAVGVGTSSKVGIGCISGAMAGGRSENRRTGGSMGGMGGGMRGGMSGGGMGGMGGVPGGSMGTTDTTMYEKTKLWLSTELVSAP